MEFTVQQVADQIGAKVEGRGEAKISALCKIEEGTEGGLSFLANEKYTHYIYETKATAVIVADSFVPQQKVSTTLIRVPNPYMAFAKLLAFYNQQTLPEKKISPLAAVKPSVKIAGEVYIGEFTVIEEGAEIGENCYIYPQVYIGRDVKIGKGTVLYPGVKIYADCRVGEQCVIHSGAVIGADGFGFAPNNGSYDKVPQTGNVVIRDFVEIGANTCIDKATLGSTVIEEGVKLDNLIQIAHNVVVGKNTVMASQTGVSGSSKIGENCMFGGQVGIAGHLEIASGVKLGAQSGVPSSLKREEGVYMGTPAIEVNTFRRSAVHFKNLSKIVNRLEKLEKEVGK